MINAFAGGAFTGNELILIVSICVAIWLVNNWGKKK
jgi:hypothetical protein